MSQRDPRSFVFQQATDRRRSEAGAIIVVGLLACYVRESTAARNRRGLKSEFSPENLPDRVRLVVQIVSGSQ